MPDVTLDTRAVTRMLERLERQADRADHAVERVARAATVTGIPVGDTGRLARSVRVRREDDGAWVLSTDVPYARFVFGGTKYVAARPPHVKAPPLADEVAREVFT